jgi:hypothetical protein
VGHSRPVTGLLCLYLNFLESSGPATGLFYLYLNFLEPSGPLQACNGTALLYTQLCHVIRVTSNKISSIMPENLEKHKEFLTKFAFSDDAVAFQKFKVTKRN